MLPALHKLSIHDVGAAAKRQRRTLAVAVAERKPLLNALYGGYFLDDAVVYRCTEEVELYPADEGGSFVIQNGDDDEPYGKHFSWRKPLTGYGNTCIAVSVRALERSGFGFDMGNWWGIFVKQDQDLPGWHTEYILKTMVYATLDAEFVASLREEDQWTGFSDEDMARLRMYERGVFDLTPEQWGEARESVIQEYNALVQRAVETAPFWVGFVMSVLIMGSGDSEIEPPDDEFVVTLGDVDADEARSKFLTCVVAAQRDEELSFELDSGVSPGTPEAKLAVEEWISGMMREEDA
jgi:hypothetical protein